MTLSLIRLDTFTIPLIRAATKILVLDPVLVERLADAVFDFKESNGSDGAGFTLDVF